MTSLIPSTDNNHQSSNLYETQKISHNWIVSNKTGYLVEFSPREQQLTAVSRAAPSWHSPVGSGHERGTRRHHLCQPLDLLFEPLHLAFKHLFEPLHLDFKLLVGPLDLASQILSLFELIHLSSKVSTALGRLHSNKCNANVCIDPGVLPWFANCTCGSSLPSCVCARAAGRTRCLHRDTKKKHTHKQHYQTNTCQVMMENPPSVLKE
jgi:hypothetical protein